MKTIDWDAIPEIFSWVAIDQNGELYAYTGKPVLVKAGGWVGKTSIQEKLLCRLEYPGWQESLQQRPTPSLDLSRPVRFIKNTDYIIYDVIPLDEDEFLVTFHLPNQSPYSKRYYTRTQKNIWRMLRRMKMSTIKINWDEIPKKYKWASINGFGNVCAFEHKPCVVGQMWLSEGEQVMINNDLLNPLKDWRKSLRERPSSTTIPVTLLDDLTVAGFKLPLTYGVTFYGENNTEVGKLEWNNDTMEFSGNATESAKVFFEQIQRQFHAAIEIEIERRIEEAQSNGESHE